MCNICSSRDITQSREAVTSCESPETDEGRGAICSRFLRGKPRVPSPGGGGLFGIYYHVCGIYRSLQK